MLRSGAVPWSLCVEFQTAIIHNPFVRRSFDHRTIRVLSLIRDRNSGQPIHVTEFFGWVEDDHLPKRKPGCVFDGRNDHALHLHHTQFESVRDGHERDGHNHWTNSDRTSWLTNCLSTVGWSTTARSTRQWMAVAVVHSDYGDTDEVTLYCDCDRPPN